MKERFLAPLGMTKGMGARLGSARHDKKPGRLFRSFVKMAFHPHAR